MTVNDRCKGCREYDASEGTSTRPTITESAAFGGAYYLRPRPGDAPFDNGPSMESALRQLGAWLEHGQQVYRYLQNYATNGVAVFESPASVEPIPASALAYHANNLANVVPTATAPTVAAPTVHTGAVTVATNHTATIDHARSLLIVAVDLSVKNSDGKAKDGSAKFHHCKPARGQRTVQVAGSRLCYTISVGSHTTPHGDAQTYDGMSATINSNLGGMTPAQNMGVYRQGVALHIYAHFDARRVNAVTLANGSLLWSRSTAIANVKRRTVFLTDGTWVTFRMWTTPA